MSPNASQVIVIFEFSPHPHCSDERFASSIRMLDAIIKTLGLPYADVELEQASVFPEGVAPMLLPSEKAEEDLKVVKAEPDVHTDEANGQQVRDCGCAALTQTPVRPMASSPRDPKAHFAADSEPVDALGFAGSARWGQDWSEGMIRQEQIRRVCWSSCVFAWNLCLITCRMSIERSRLLTWTSNRLQVVGSYTSYQFAFGRPLSQYFITKPSNVSRGLISTRSLYKLSFISLPCFSRGKPSQRQYVANPPSGHSTRGVCSCGARAPRCMPGAR